VETQLEGLAGTPGARALAWGVQSLLLGETRDFAMHRGYDDRRERDEGDAEATCA
jgi:hypothetical protein